MAINIIDTIQQHLNYAPLQKINTENPETLLPQMTTIDRIGQAAIPLVLAALYTLTRHEQGCRIILTGSDKKDWLSTIFEGKEDAVIEKVALYAGVTINQAESHLENIADESIRIINEWTGPHQSIKKIQETMDAEWPHILAHLPQPFQPTN